MKPILVKVDQVPKDKRDHAKFIALRDDMQKEMANPLVVKSVCIHEAAHVLLALGLKMDVQGLEGPHILYDPSTDDFSGQAAMVTIRVVENAIEDCAKMFAAGGVASVDIAPTLGPGNEGDIIRFNALCERVGVTDPEKRLKVWRDAEGFVREYLKVEQNKNAVLMIAEDLVAELEKGS